MCEDRRNDHEQAACNGKREGKEALERGECLLPADRHEEDGDVQRVKGDDRKLRGIEADRPEPGLRELRAVEIQQPERGEKEAQHGGVGGHVGLAVHLLEYRGRGAAVARGERIDRKSVV